SEGSMSGRAGIFAGMSQVIEPAEMPPVLLEEKYRPIDLRCDLELMKLHVAEDATQNVRQVDASGAGIGDQFEVDRARADVVRADAPARLVPLAAMMMRYGRAWEIAPDPAAHADPGLKVPILGREASRGAHALVESSGLQQGSAPHPHITALHDA